ncbi:MAG: hypothetical protein ABJB16_08415 [Saprospiraceae bacterium]
MKTTFVLLQPLRKTTLGPFLMIILGWHMALGKDEKYNIYVT